MFAGDFSTAKRKNRAFAADSSMLFFGGAAALFRLRLNTGFGFFAILRICGVNIVVACNRARRCAHARSSSFPCICIKLTKKLFFAALFRLRLNTGFWLRLFAAEPQIRLRGRPISLVLDTGFWLRLFAAEPQIRLRGRPISASPQYGLWLRLLRRRLSVAARNAPSRSKKRSKIWANRANTQAR